jgi:four helix bundle protein
VLREADETLYWLELLAEGKVFKPSLLQPLMKECGELVAIFASTVKSTRFRSKKPNLKSEI